MMAEETKNEAAEHLLRLGNGSFVPTLPHLERRTQGLLGGNGSSTHRKQNQAGPFRNVGVADRPIREFSVVEGQFDDAPEPPSLPPLRGKAAYAFPATTRGGPGGGTSGYINYYHDNMQRSGRAPMPIAPTNFSTLPYYNRPTLSSNPPAGLGANRQAPAPPHTFPNTQHYHPSMGRGRSTNPHLPPPYYRQEQPHNPHSNNLTTRLPPLAPRPVMQVQPTITNPPMNSGTATNQDTISSMEALQHYSHARTLEVSRPPGQLQEIAPRPILQARPPAGVIDVDAPQQQQYQQQESSRNNNAGGEVKKRARSQSYGTVLGTRRDKEKQQQQPHEQPPAAPGLVNNNNNHHQYIAKHPSPILIPDSSVPYHQRIPAKLYVPADAAKRCPVTEVELRDKDVLMGRGGLTNQHVGNMWFRDLIAHYRKAYCTVAKGQKRQLADNLRNFVRTCAGRFLECDKIDKNWYECGDERAVLKIGQALREGTAVAIRKLLGKSDHSTTDGDDDDDEEGRTADDSDDVKQDEKKSNGEVKNEEQDRESKRQRLG
jgi:hypothetical protein